MDEKELKEAVASYMKDPAKRDALAALIVEYIQPNHITTDFVGMLLNTRSLNPGDALLKKVRKGIRVNTLVPGAIHLSSEITLTERMNFMLDGADVKVTANEWELEQGAIGTVDEIKAEMLAKLKDFYMTKVFTALSTVWSGSNTPSNYTAVGAQVTAAALENAIDWINKTTGGVKCVIGSRAAMIPISKFGGFWNDHAVTPTVWGRDAAIEEVMQQGILGKYYGAQLITIDQVYNYIDVYQKMIPEDKVLVIGDNVGEFITYGDVKTKQWTNMEPTPPQWYLEFYQQFGMIIDNAMGIYVLKLG